MKRLLTLIFLLSFFAVSAQIAGTKVDGPYTTKDGTVFKEGDKFDLGLGTLPNGAYKYIVMPPNVLAGVSGQYLGANANGMTLEIKFFKIIKSKKMGDKTIAVVNPGGFNYAVDIDAAIQAGEILTANSSKGKTTPVSNTSKADELKKLKELLDSGALTQEEYDQEKKKILDAN